jgi:hypothetical protein
MLLESATEDSRTDEEDEFKDLMEFTSVSFPDSESPIIISYTVLLFFSARLLRVERRYILPIKRIVLVVLLLFLREEDSFRISDQILELELDEFEFKFDRVVLVLCKLDKEEEESLLFAAVVFVWVAVVNLDDDAFRVILVLPFLLLWL